MRVFVGIDLDPEVRRRIERFTEEVRGFAPEAKWIRTESLHVTLKFIGEQPQDCVDSIAAVLETIEMPSFELAIAENGFFPNAKAPRVFWIGVGPSDRLLALAKRVDDVVAELGLAREERPYSPHLTLARGPGRSSGSPTWGKGDRANSVFAPLQKRLEQFRPPIFGTMAVREFILYQSQLSPSGSKYTKLRRFPLQNGVGSRAE